MWWSRAPSTPRPPITIENTDPETIYTVALRCTDWLGDSDLSIQGGQRRATSLACVAFGTESTCARLPSNQSCVAGVGPQATIVLDVTPYCTVKMDLTEFGEHVVTMGGKTRSFQLLPGVTTIRLVPRASAVQLCDRH